MHAEIVRSSGTGLAHRPEAYWGDKKTRTVPEVILEENVFPLSHGTSFVSRAGIGFNIVERKPTKRLDERTYSIGVSPDLSFDADIDPKVERMKADRVALLARTMRRQSATPLEDNFRIEILTERLRRLFPRVTAKETDRCRQSVEDLEASSAFLSRMNTLFAE